METQGENRVDKFYVTTSIAYANAEPHIGYAQEVLAADVLARYHREIKKDKTFFLTGTDEHGFSVQKFAEKAGKEPREFVDELVEKFKGLHDLLNLSNDAFVRTTDPKHQKNVIEIWNKSLARGDIYKKSYRGLYCFGCEALLNPRELVDGRCPNHPNLVPDPVEEENWFFKLSSYRDKLLQLYNDNPEFVRPKERFNEIKSLVESGLEDVSVSRPKEKLSWGIEVPNDPTHVMYVWFDALTNYLYPRDWLPADLHIIGKDILRFHAALWPAMLMSAGYELPKQLFVHGFISVEGQKMSKTVGNVIKPEDLVEKFGVDGSRYLLLRELPFGSDSDFSWNRMQESYNANLANDLGNLLQRTIVMTKNYKVEIAKDAGVGCAQAGKLLEQLSFSDSLAEIWRIINDANRFIDQKKPWEIAKQGRREELVDILQSLHQRLYTVANSLIPYLPETAEKMKKQLGTLQPEPLFPRMV